MHCSAQCTGKAAKSLVGFWNPGTEDVNRLISFPVITKLGCRVSRRIENILHPCQSGYLLFYKKIKYLWDMNHIFNTYASAQSLPLFLIGLCLKYQE